VIVLHGGPGAPGSAEELAVGLSDMFRVVEPWQRGSGGPDRLTVATQILGAGFSYGAVPLVRELMHETIGAYYCPDQDQSSLERPQRILQKNAAEFWCALEKCASRRGWPAIPLDGNGLPSNPGDAYKTLFSYRLVNEPFACSGLEQKSPMTWLVQVLLSATFRDHCRRKHRLLSALFALRRRTCAQGSSAVRPAKSRLRWDLKTI
jgi:hypothetical protein